MVLVKVRFGSKSTRNFCIGDRQRGSEREREPYQFGDEISELLGLPPIVVISADAELYGGRNEVI